MRVVATAIFRMSVLLFPCARIIATGPVTVGHGVVNNVLTSPDSRDHLTPSRADGDGFSKNRRSGHPGVVPSARREGVGGSITI